GRVAHHRAGRRPLYRGRRRTGCGRAWGGAAGRRWGGRAAAAWRGAAEPAWGGRAEPAWGGAAEPALIHPAVRDLFLDLGRHPAFQDAVRSLTAGANAALSGLTNTAKALYTVLLREAVNRPLLVVVDGNKQAEAISEA